MNNLIDEDFSEKIDLDELYERKLQLQELRMDIYKNILNRVHKKIKITARQKHDSEFCFYVVPEFIMGVPRYDVQTCISYIVDKLSENGLNVKYTHPNLLFISWSHYIPRFKRQEIKKLTGQNVDGFGNVIVDKEEKGDINQSLANNTKSTSVTLTKQGDKDYNKIDNYKPLGIYNNDFLQKLKKINND